MTAPAMTRPDTLAEVHRRVTAGEAPYDHALPEFLDAFYPMPRDGRQCSTWRRRPGPMRCAAQSPTAFRRRLIFTEAEPLRRARMPRAA